MYINTYVSWVDFPGIVIGAISIPLPSASAVRCISLVMLPKVNPVSGFPSRLWYFKSVNPDGSGPVPVPFPGPALLATVLNIPFRVTSFSASLSIVTFYIAHTFKPLESTHFGVATFIAYLIFVLLASGAPEIVSAGFIVGSGVGSGWGVIFEVTVIVSTKSLFIITS